MATLTFLKHALRQKATAVMLPSIQQPLSDEQYSTGFNILAGGSGWQSYQDFIIPQLSQLLASVFDPRKDISILEIGPGPKSVVGYLPRYQRQQIKRYTAFEPNSLFATSLREWISSNDELECPLPSLETSADIIRAPFALRQDGGCGFKGGVSSIDKKYNIVLFCHSMYGMKPKRHFIEQALQTLVERPSPGMVIVFHRDGALHFDGLVCHRTASFPTGIVRIADRDGVLDSFTSFISGFGLKDGSLGETVRGDWRKTCRTLSRFDEAYPDHLSFSSPHVMVAFTKSADSLSELLTQVPAHNGQEKIKNWEARLRQPASIVRPTDIGEVQQCVQWALKHKLSLNVIGGSHSGHCLWSNVVSIDMSAFDRIDVYAQYEGKGTSGPLVVAGAGCKIGDIVRKTMTADLTVPLGARPSVGAGLWLQGGIGHLARLHGLACDAIIGAVIVSVDSSQVFYLGCTPVEHRPENAIRPENHSELLWAIKGAGTNFGVVVSLTFKSYKAPTYLIRRWVIPLNNELEIRLRLGEFDNMVAKKLDRSSSADAYLYWTDNQLHLGVVIYEPTKTKLARQLKSFTRIDALWGRGDDSEVVDGVGLFDTEMYVSKMHGGHGGGKTSSFKRCVFLKRIGEAEIADRLAAAISTRVSSLCYLHLIQGGGAVSDVPASATAFACREWDFCCVITAVWPRGQESSEVAQSSIRWVYDVVRDLLSLGAIPYGADLGPDPRDIALAAKAFGRNRPRLVQLKARLDPYNVLAYACPLPKASMGQQLIILVTGESCAGKDYCADVWVSVFQKCNNRRLKARAVSISDAIKREYAAATTANLGRLLRDRAYKEQHRPALTEYFYKLVQQRPRLLEEQFLNVLYESANFDVLIITGLREKGPVAALGHLEPERRLIEVHVQASEETRKARRGLFGDESHGDKHKDVHDYTSQVPALNHRPDLIFENNATGKKAITEFAEQYLLPFFDDDLQLLAGMILSISDFPSLGVEFRHVLGVAQHPGGLSLCTSLLRTRFSGQWVNMDAVVSCEAGGFIFASALASQVNLRLVLVREAGKLPPPTISVMKQPSHVSSLGFSNSKEKRIEMEQGVLRVGASVLIVDDVLATGETLCAMLQLLNEAGISPENISIMTLLEFPAHRGRQLLQRRGFGKSNVQSLLVSSAAMLHLRTLTAGAPNFALILKLKFERNSAEQPNCVGLPKPGLDQGSDVGKDSMEVARGPAEPTALAREQGDQTRLIAFSIRILPSPTVLELDVIGTAAVSYDDGRIEHVAHIVGSAEYVALMHHLTTDTHRLDPPPLDTIGEKLEYARKQARRRLNLLLGRPGSATAATLSTVLNDLREHVPHDIPQGAIGIAIPNAALASIEEINDALAYAGFKKLEELQMPDRELNAAYAAYGWGLCPSFTDPYECEKEENSPEMENWVLHIDYSDESLAASTNRISSARSSYATVRFVDWTLGRKNANNAGDAHEYWHQVQQRLSELFVAGKRPFTKILLTGDRAQDERFREILRDAGRSALDAEEAIPMPIDFAYAVARGAAEMQRRRQRGWLNCVKPKTCVQSSILWMAKATIQRVFEL